ncbi:RDD family protein [Oleiharenicola lentus]|uniref:RDD family protein n=1 Tax=Oleiharenicola lentus TaxID=2508720 RepID=A0A4Q1C4Y7_9BACT|nr:RDD family protein [Oleiharenicola lentus]RXK53329.1 RDD family protein [Oleiharenicola lentus]
MEWFYANGGNRVGPVNPEAFEALINGGTITGETLVWSKSMAEWRPYAQVAAETAVCAASGGRHWQKDMVPFEGKFISAEHKEQYFQRLREGVQLPNQMVYGNFGRRLIAKIVDGLITGLVGLGADLGLSALFFGDFIFRPKPNTPEIAASFLAYQGASLLVGTAIGLAYTWYFLKKYAATPGKLAFGLRVVRSDGSALTNGRIIGRHFAEMLSGLILLIGYIMAGFDEERRTLHDRICDTRVIKIR